jgi:hypothetical protein
MLVLHFTYVIELHDDSYATSSVEIVGSKPAVRCRATSWKVASSHKITTLIFTEWKNVTASRDVMLCGLIMATDIPPEKTVWYTASGTAESWRESERVVLFLADLSFTSHSTVYIVAFW